MPATVCSNCLAAHPLLDILCPPATGELWEMFSLLNMQPSLGSSSTQMVVTGPRLRVLQACKAAKGASRAPARHRLISDEQKTEMPSN